MLEVNQTKKTATPVCKVFLAFVLSTVLSTHILVGCSGGSDDDSSTVVKNGGKPCGAGKYRPSGEQKCTFVKEGYVSSEGSDIQSPCEGNQVPNKTKTVCENCSNGRRANAKHSRCDSGTIPCKTAVANGAGTQTWDSSIPICFLCDNGL